VLRIFGPNRAEGTAGSRILHNDGSFEVLTAVKIQVEFFY
jgi:hypothetical protein